MMKITPVLWAAGLAAFSGCASIGPQHASRAAASEPIDLVVGVLPFRPNGCPKTDEVYSRAVSDMAGRGYFESVSEAASRQDPSFDVFVQVDINLAGISMNPTVTALLPSGKRLYTGKANSQWTSLCGVDGGNIAALLSGALEKGTAGYAQAAAEREECRSRQPLVAAGAPSGLTKGDLAEIVKAAVATAQAQPAAPPTAVASDVEAPAYHEAADPAKFAIVVGIEKYADLPEARFAERDAKAVKAHLLALGFPERNIVLLTGQQATKTGLAKYLETWLERNVDERSTVFFYFSGHGAPDPSTGQAYLLPTDGDPSYLQDTGYPVKRLYERLETLKARRALVALDSCFSGAGGRSVIAKGTRPLVAVVDAGRPSTGKVVALTASKASEVSGTLEEKGHGAFTYYLLRGLNGAAKDGSGAVTVTSLYEYLKPNVEDAARRGNRDQSPQLLRAPDAAELKLR